MLIQFSIENHRSIKDSAVISFAASKDKSLESYLLHPDEKRHFYRLLLFTERMPPARVMCCTH